jgi:peptide/nickel transport system permease protein
MRLITRRIALYVVTAIVAITVNFFIPRLMPGNPVLAVLGRLRRRAGAPAGPWCTRSRT